MSGLVELLYRGADLVRELLKQREARKRSKIQRDRYTGKAAGEAALEAAKKAGK